MSTVKATTLSNLAGTQSVPVDTVAQGSAKAWVNFNGTGTVAIRAAFNVSSITDVSVGRYTVNMANPMPDANYAPMVSGNTATGGITAYGAETLAVGSFAAFTYVNGAAFDPALVTVTVHR